MSEPFTYQHEQLARLDNGRIPIFLTEDQYSRTKACWDACAGIPTEELEATSNLNELYKELRRERDVAKAKQIVAERQRDQLLALLKAIQSGQEFTPEFCKRLDEVIAKCENEK